MFRMFLPHLILELSIICSSYLAYSYDWLERWWWCFNTISGTRYGASLRKQIKKMEVSQHSKYFCEFCGKVTFIRLFPYDILSGGLCQKLVLGASNYLMKVACLYSMQWRGRLLESGVAKTAAKLRLEELTPWS